MRGPARRRIILLLVVGLAGCGGGEGGPPVAGMETRDSAGVEVITYPHGGFADSATGLPLERVYQTGWGEGDPELAFVRIGLLLPGGRALFFDAQWHELFLLDREGRVERRLGREGEGPGEYQSVSALHLLPGDSVLVWDGVQRRVTILDPALEFARDYTWTGTGGTPERRISHAPSGVTRSGEVVWTPDGFRIRTLESGLHWIDAPVLAGPARFEADDSVMSLPFVQLRSEGGEVVTHPFRPTGWMSGHPSGVLWARNDRPELRWYTAEGGLSRIVRWAHEPVEVTDAVWAEYADAYVEVMLPLSRTRDESAMREALDEDRARAAPHLPVFRSLDVGSDGTIWLGEFVFTGRTSDRHLVFGPDGEWIGAVRAPPSFELLDATRDLVLGVERNELDVPAVGLYRRPSGS